jgi:hypothetical protein
MSLESHELLEASLHTVKHFQGGFAGSVETMGRRGRLYTTAVSQSYCT